MIQNNINTSSNRKQLYSENNSEPSKKHNFESESELDIPEF